MLQGSRQNTQPQQIPQFVPQLVQDNSNTLPQASQSQNPAHPQGEVGLEAEVVEVKVEEV